MNKMKEIKQIEKEAKNQELKKITIGSIDFLTNSDKGLKMLEGWKKINDMIIKWDKERMKNFGKHLLEK